MSQRAHCPRGVSTLRAWFAKGGEHKGDVHVRGPKVGVEYERKTAHEHDERHDVRCDADADRLGAHSDHAKHDDKERVDEATRKQTRDRTADQRGVDRDVGKRPSASVGADS